MKRSNLLWLVLLCVVAISSFVFMMWAPKKGTAATLSSQDTTVNPAKGDTEPEKKEVVPVTMDTAAYNQRMAKITNGDSSGRWPVKTPYPLAGAILPFKRVIAYYGNLYSKNMGILGELPEKEMTDKLMGEVKKWETADPETPVQPALHYIAVTAQQSPGAGGKYRLRMPFAQIDKVMAMAAKIDAIVFLDIQVGLSNLESEVPQLEQYLKLPNVHLGIDPEFSMKTGHAPGKVVGTFDAADINYTINYLAKLVKDNNLPPKILVVHRFTGPMVTNSNQIKPQAEVQVVMHMDGWGEAERKIGTYKRFIYPQPVQFTGFKMFYKNDTKKVNRAEVMQPEALLKLKPQPMYIQYQ
ncbi:MAG: hypothetical protein WCF67_20285 [Chitinophagaceae bacterium]